MKNGIVGPDDGFNILVNGEVRTFRDIEAYAYEAAAYLKVRAPADLVQVVNRAQLTTVVVNADGRLSS